MGYNKKYHKRKIESFYGIFTSLTQNCIFYLLQNVTLHYLDWVYLYMLHENMSILE